MAEFGEANVPAILIIVLAELAYLALRKAGYRLSDVPEALLETFRTLINWWRRYRHDD